MKTFPLPIFIVSIGVSFGVGFSLAWNIPGPPVVAQTPAANAATAQAAPATGMNHYASLWNKTGPTQQTENNSASAKGPVPAQEPQKTQFDEEEKLRRMAQSDPATLQSLIQRFQSERDLNTKEMLKTIIGSVNRPEVLALSARLATSSNPAQRKEAFELLQQAPASSADVRNTVRQALATEQSPEVLVQALAALKPTTVEPAESEAIVSQLKQLSQNADPTVRSQSLLQLAQWDKTGSASDRMSQALSDPEPQVRQAAIFAVAQSGVRSDSVKSALISMINSSTELKEVKGSALQVLERFSLSKEEYASYNQARAQVGL